MNHPSQINFAKIDSQARRVTPALVDSVKREIVYRLSPEKVVLFGSQATGSATNESDIDLLVVLRDDHPWAALKRYERCGFLLAMFKYRTFSLDVLVLTDAEIQQIKTQNEGEWDMILEILGEGKKLYERTA